jgi:glycine/D-amino acid oxidase-like deaminating enzyme
VQGAESRRFDVAIIGGGVVGCSAAYFLKQLAPTTSVSPG